MEKDIIHSEERGEIVLYQPNDNIRLEVRLQDETVWLTQQQMAELFSTTRNNITLHIGNIFKEGELQEDSVRKESLLTASDGKNYRTKFYNLDVIISVGHLCERYGSESMYNNKSRFFRRPSSENGQWLSHG